MLRHWYKPGFWRWRWQQASLNAKALLVLLGTALVVFGGYESAALISSAEAGNTAGGAIAVRTVEVKAKPLTVVRVVTVREHGRTIRRMVPGARTVTGPGKTYVVTETTFRTNGATTTVTTPGAFRPPVTVTAAGKAVTVAAPTTVVRTRVVPRTVTETKVVNTGRVVTSRQVVTDQRTVTSQETVVSDHVVTQPVTTTVTSTATVGRTATATQTVAVTTTVPAATTVTRTTTVTQTVPLTVTQLVTVTEPITVTVHK